MSLSISFVWGRLNAPEMRNGKTGAAAGVASVMSVAVSNKRLK